MPRTNNTKYKWGPAYKPPPLRKLNKNDNEGNIFVNNPRDDRLQVKFNHSHREVTKNRRFIRNSSEKVWYKITIPHGAKYEKSQLLSLLQQNLSIPMNAIYVHNKSGSTIFWVEYIEVFKELMALSYTIKSPEGYKLKIFGVKDKAPNPPELDSHYIEHLKNAMSTRYNIDSKHLNLTDFANDSNLKSKSIHLPLFRVNVMKEVINIIEKHIPQVETIDLSSNKLSYLYHISSFGSKVKNVNTLSLSNNQLKSEGELYKIKDLPLKKLNLQGNPLVKYFSDKETYISAIRKIFPHLQILDDMELPKVIKFDLEEGLSLPKIQPSSTVNEDINSLIKTFINQYYTLYDSKNRIELVQAYDENAYFSLSAGTTPAAFFNKKHSDIKTYFSHSRNLQRMKDKDRRLKLMQEGANKIVSFLTLLPETKHHSSSFVTDVSLYTNTLLVFSITGKFTETDTGLIRYFARTFYTVPFGSGIKIINDMLYVMAPTQEMIKEVSSVNDRNNETRHKTSFHPNTNAQAQTASSLSQFSPLSSTPIHPHFQMHTPSRGPPLLATPPISSLIFPSPPIATHLTSPNVNPIPNTSQFNPTTQQTPYVLPTTGEDSKLEMVRAFSTATGMNHAWSFKCLQDNDWDYQAALANFNSCKSEGVIPPEAFAPIS